MTDEAASKLMKKWDWLCETKPHLTPGDRMSRLCSFTVSLLGKRLSVTEARAILRSLGYEVEEPKARPVLDTTLAKREFGSKLPPPYIVDGVWVRPKHLNPNDCAAYVYGRLDRESRGRAAAGRHQMAHYADHLDVLVGWVGEESGKPPCALRDMKERLQTALQKGQFPREVLR